ncbi:MAG TPA: DUF3187 family protein [Povalibacter sp.]|uniref:DUF3187 family protein n=1 Tax=Povalibacter sp. TaxID=1962978 RepID=UPI002C9364EC|nr:DUF3187 family protein [Povalibacter sp.]HMN43380.1 DUF3187 family protein [Povalibacter sp.]
MSIVRATAIATVALIAALAGSVVHADETRYPFYGLLRSRDLTTFGFLRLDMRPAYAVSIEPGSWAIETELGYQNTWSLSPEVEKYLTALEPTGRRRIGPDEIAAIQALPGENYLLDLESANFDLTFHYKFDQHWTGYAIISAVSYNGGFLDGTIESFHKALGFSTFGRPALTKNDVRLIYDLKGAQLTSLGSPTDGGLTDPTFGIRYTGFDMPEKWAFSLEGAVKVPVGGERTLLSTGKTDVGLQASLQRFFNRNALYLNVAGVYYAGAEFPVRQGSRVIPTLVFGWEYAFTQNTSFNLQGYVSRSVYTDEQTDLDELTGEKYQYTIGFRHRWNQVLLSFGITENVQNINNTPDVGLQLGLAWIPQRKPRP